MQTQNYFLELGLINTLKIDRFATPGAYLMAQDGKDVLLPGQYLTPKMKEGDLIDVFLYTDSEDRLVATTQTPKLKLDEFGLLEIVDITPFGAFLDWGLPKDLLLPKKLQKTTAVLGEKRFIKIIYDEKTHRLVATEKLGDMFDRKIIGLKKGQKVSAIILSKTPLGYKCLVENKYEGLLYHNEIFEELHIGDVKEVFVKTLRKDAKLDLSLKQPGTKKGAAGSLKIIEQLQKSKGMMPYNYKSDATLIKETFSMSKKEFKAALTQLKENNTIEVKETGIYLLKK